MTVFGKIGLSPVESKLNSCQKRHLLRSIACAQYVTGSEKRYIVAHTMIFLYKRCCSKTRNIFYSLKKKFFFGLQCSPQAV